MNNVISNNDNFIFCIENEGVMTRIKEFDKCSVAGLRVQGTGSDY